MTITEDDRPTTDDHTTARPDRLARRARPRRRRVGSSDESPNGDARFAELRASGDPRLREELILDYRWIAERCASRFRDRGEPFDDLLQAANLALVKAVDRFDPEHGATFPRYALPSVLGELRRHFRDHTWRVSVSRRSKDLGANINLAIDHLTQRDRRSPRPGDVAEFLGIPLEHVLEALEARAAYRPTSISAPGSADDATLEDILGHTDSELDGADERLTVREATEHLDPRRRKIIIWRFYEGCTQSEIGERLGIGQVQVSRLMRSALADLKIVVAGNRPASRLAS
jgi:RNA polymerase sigma-B factor